MERHFEKFLPSLIRLLLFIQSVCYGFWKKCSEFEKREILGDIWQDDFPLGGTAVHREREGSLLPRAAHL